MHGPVIKRKMNASLSGRWRGLVENAEVITGAGRNAMCAEQNQVTNERPAIPPMRYDTERIFAVYAERARIEAENLYLIGQIANLVI